MTAQAAFLVTPEALLATTSRPTKHHLMVWKQQIRHPAMETVPALCLLIPLWETQWGTAPLYQRQQPLRSGP